MGGRVDWEVVRVQVAEAERLASPCAVLDPYAAGVYHTIPLHAAYGHSLSQPHSSRRRKQEEVPMRWWSAVMLQCCWLSRHLSTHKTSPSPGAFCPHTQQWLSSTGSRWSPTRTSSTRFAGRGKPGEARPHTDQNTAACCPVLLLLAAGHWPRTPAPPLSPSRAHPSPRASPCPCCVFVRSLSAGLASAATTTSPTCGASTRNC